jgi:hypothetical protein
MRECRVCGIGRRCEEFASVNGYIRNVCRECRNRQRRQRTSEAMSNDDASETVSIGPSTLNRHPPLLLPSIVGGASPAGVVPEPPGVFDLHDEQEGRLRLIEGQLQALTDEHRTGSMRSIGQRLVQLEHEMQSLRGAVAVCECSGRDPLWLLFVWLACTTLMFVLLRWVEGRLLSKRKACTNVQHMAVAEPRATCPT